MTRRTLFPAILLCAVSAVVAGPARFGRRWITRARRRREIAAHFEESAAMRKRSARTLSAVCERLERIDVDPGLQEERLRDLARLRSMAEQNAKRAEHYLNLAAEYRRAASRPWRKFQPGRGGTG